MKKKVTILGFGGTIAMVPDSDGVLAPAKTVDELMSFVPQLAEMADIELIQLENVDSTNITPEHWKKLAEAIWSLSDATDGIIVTHGTDTMPYTASAIALAVGRHFQLPVVFTGSQLPIAEFGSDARFNLENSMKAILRALDENIAEVMIVFSDRVMRATRSIKTSEDRFDAFDSPAFPYLARITASGVRFTATAFTKVKPMPDSRLKADFDGEIFAIDLVPGLDPSLLRSMITSTRCEAILLKSLGAGNVPSEGEHSLIPAIEEAGKKNIPVLISTKFVGGRTIADLYEPGKKAIDAGAIPTRDMTDVTAQVKLMWLLAQGFHSPGQLREKITRSYAGEVS